MLFHLQFDSPIPPYEQIVAQVIFAIASGSLEVGTLLPSVRELGPRILVHPNTVAKAYQELERLGVIVARRGKGMEVTHEAPALCRERRSGIVRQHIRDALHEAVTSALPPDEIRDLVEQELAYANGQRRTKDNLKESIREKR
ncbi:MAG TPA: GntR family transcriptional regulator [Gemmataceae bacterium]|jgi:GntR family transcriptional regulator|nr:GntR family transcriptional regulator [Gemmataceae bacterium]